MRKVLSFVLVLALVLGSFSMAFATPSDVVGTDNEEAVNVLMGLGVVDGYEDGTFKPDQAVTRAEMAKLIVVALGLDDYAIGTSSFTDMTGAGWAQGYVAYAASLGVVKGYPDGTFKPGQTVSYDEAAAMIVRALGYTDESLTGTWPANYVVKAKALGILDGIKSVAGGADRGDIAEMLYNALSLDIGYVNNDGDWVSNDTSADGDNPDNMLVRLGAQLIEADDEDALADVDQAEDGVIYGDEDSVINLRAYVGAYADRYVNDDDEIIMVLPISVFLTGDWDNDGEDCAGTFTADDVDYNVSDVLADTYGAYFYNGYSDGSTSSLCSFDPEWSDLTIAVEVSGKTIKEIYSIAEWSVDEAALFTDDDADDIADDQTLFGFDFILDDNDDIDMDAFELLGAASLDDIDEDNVVYVYADGDDIRKIEVGTEIVEGEITKISSDGDYTIAGSKYSESEEAVDIEGGIEDEVKAYLDYAGDIFQMEITEGTVDQYAIVLETGDGTGTGLTGYDPAIKLFLADATDETFDVDSDGIVDAIIDGNDWSDDWMGTTPASMLVEYGLDDDGVVDSLTEPAVVMYADVDNDDLTAKGYYDGYKVASDAVIFTYDGDSSAAERSDEDNYGVTTLDKIKDTDNVVADYVVDDGEIVAMLVYDYDEAEDVYGVVTDWSETADGYEMEFLINGEAVTYDATDDAFVYFDENYDYLYELSFNAAGEVNGLMTVDYAYELDLPLRDGYVLNDAYTLDNTDLVVYLWNDADGVFETKALRDIDDKYNVQIYDTLDDDSIYDVVLILD